MSNLTRYQEKKKILKQCATLAASIAIVGVLSSEAALAAGFDLDKGIQAASDPLLALITKYYPVALAVGGSVGAIVGQGDLRARGVNAAIGVGVAGGAILAMLKAVS